MRASDWMWGQKNLHKLPSAGHTACVTRCTLHPIFYCQTTRNSNTKLNHFLVQRPATVTRFHHTRMVPRGAPRMARCVTVYAGLKMHNVFHLFVAGQTNGAHFISFVLLLVVKFSFLALRTFTLVHRSYGRLNAIQHQKQVQEVGGVAS